jgi:mannose-6-phosphate isomerase-like protein (cupin superfamily)
MDDFSQKILKELLPVEKELAPRAPSKKDEAPHIDHWSHPVLLERAAYLRKLAKFGDGQASETLQQYPHHAAMLSFRARDGEAELYEHFADIFCVLDGRATLITGGRIVESKVIAPGETRGTSILGGAVQELRAGDVAHVPARLAHQILVRGEQAFTSLVIKIGDQDR